MTREVLLLSFLLENQRQFDALLVHSNFANFFVRLIKGFAIAEKFGLNLL